MEAGFDVVENDYIMRQTVNKKENLCVPRVFVQSKFAKPQSLRLEEGTNNVHSGTVSSRSLDSGGDNMNCSDVFSSEQSTCATRTNPGVNGLIEDLQKDILNPSNLECNKES